MSFMSFMSFLREQIKILFPDEMPINKSLMQFSSYTSFFQTIYFQLIMIILF